jgi:hypothetical protein
MTPPPRLNISPEVSTIPWEVQAEQIRELETGELRYRSIEVLERTVRVYDDVAIVVSRDRYDIDLCGIAPGGDLRFTRVYKRVGDAWCLIATHGTRIEQ